MRCRRLVVNGSEKTAATGLCPVSVMKKEKKLDHSASRFIITSRLTSAISLLLCLTNSAHMQPLTGN